MIPLTRRDFLTQAAKVFAGGMVAASGIAVIVPKAAKPSVESLWGKKIMQGVVDGIRTNAGARHYAAQALDDFTYAMQRCSPLILDNL